MLSEESTQIMPSQNAEELRSKIFVPCFRVQGQTFENMMRQHDYDQFSTLERIQQFSVTLGSCSRSM